MQVTCDQCERILEFNGERPSFCAYCGVKLSHGVLARTDSYQPTFEPESQATQLPPSNRIITFAGVGPRLPQEINGYKVLRQLGAGGMGTVYEAEDAVNGRRVAVKLIKPQIAASPDNLERFRQEGRLASLITHPRCVFVYQADEEKGRPFIVMELMPGATLKDIVTQQGPLQVGQAISKILDVIDGLQAAHQLGVIHRDVKPSNCFVLTDGHVKVGDFGLSKVLPTEMTTLGKTPIEDQITTAEKDGADALTRTGVFVGTPLFASPEQIKGEIVDFRTDVYSVTATLYFLLTGKAPFEGGDNTATIARIVSESPASLLTMRSDIPVELDRIILRGLERNRELRFSSLAELRAALLEFQPGYLQSAPRTSRIRAAIIDAALLAPGLLLIHQLMPFLIDPQTWGHELISLISDLAMWLLILAYFLATEVVAGASFGKWLLRLRVGGLRPGKPPKRRQLLLRAIGFFVIVALPGLLALALTGNDWFKWLFHGIGLLLLFDSMRAQGGYRGLHEILSRTCVVLVPPAQKQLQFPYIPPSAPAPLPPGIPTRIGNYAIDGIHRVLDDRIFLVGSDLILDRQVWLVMRPLEEGKIAPARREISRSTRLRWLSGGDISLAQRSSKLTHHWDAYIAPSSGCSLTKLVEIKGKLSWTTTRALLLQLADELAVALTDETFPDGLALEQVWLQPDGQLMIVGARFHETPGASFESTVPDTQKSVQFLHQAAQLMLEGKVISHPQQRLIRAPIPVYDRPILNRLSGVSKEDYTNPREVANDLRRNIHRPTEVTSMMRLGQVLFHGMLVSPILLAILVVGRYYAEIKPTLQLTHQVRRADRCIDWFNDNDNIPVFKQMLLDRKLDVRYVRQVALMEFASNPQIGILQPGMRDRVVMASCQGWIKRQRIRDFTSLTAMRNQLSFPALGPQFLAVELMSGKGRDQQQDGRQHSHQSLAEDLQGALRHAFEPQRSEDEALPFVQKFTAYQLAVITIGLWFVVWIISSMMTRGGLSLKLMGIDLQTRHGRSAGPFRSAWRSLLVWLPFFGLLLLSVWIQDMSRGWNKETGPLWVYWIPWWLALIYLAGCGIYALLYPQRGFHDRLAGVYLVPK